MPEINILMLIWISLFIEATGTPFEIRYVAFGDQLNDAGFSLMATQRPCGILPHGVTQSHPQV